MTQSKITLRRWSEGDQPSLEKYANNRKVSIHLRDRFPYPYTAEDAKGWIEWTRGENPPVNFAIDLNGEAIGGIGLTMGEDIFRCSAEIGYWLGEPFWGKGYATQAVRELTEYGFKTFALTRIWAGIFESNAASGRVLEKAGYTFEFRKKRAMIKLGQVYDELLYAIVRD